MTRKPVPRPSKAQLERSYRMPGGAERLRDLERTMQQTVSSAANRLDLFEQKMREAQLDMDWIRANKETAESVLLDIASIKGSGEIAA